MSLARPARAPCDGVHLPTGFSLLLIAGWRGERMVRRRAARLARRLDGEGQTLATHALDHPPAALALGALGDRAVAALVPGPVVGLSLPPIPAKE